MKNWIIGGMVLVIGFLVYQAYFKQCACQKDPGQPEVDPGAQSEPGFMTE